MKRCFVVLFLILCLIPVFGLGISPPRYEFEYVQGVAKDLQFIASSDTTEQVTLLFEGELAPYLHSSVQNFTVSGQVPFTVHLDPLNLDKPGKHAGLVCLQQIPPSGQTATLAAIVKVCAQIWIWIPYPEKYLEGKLEISTDNELNQPVDFSVTVTSYGQQKISDVWTQLKIYDIDGQQIDTIETNHVYDLGKMERAVLHANWIAQKPGLYKADGTVFYDDLSYDLLEQTFRVGAVSVDILDLVFDSNFKLGNINKVGLKVKSNWNELIKNVYADLIFTCGSQQQSVRTAPQDLNPWEEKVLYGYWDSSNVNARSCTVKAIVYYANTQSEKTFVKTFSEQRRTTNLTGMTILLFLGIAIIILILAIIYRLRR